MVKKWPKNPKKSQKIGKNEKILVILDETHQNITKKRQKSHFYGPGGPKKGPKRVKKGHFGHFSVGKMAYLAIRWVQKGSKKWPLWPQNGTNFRVSDGHAHHFRGGGGGHFLTPNSKNRPENRKPGQTALQRPKNTVKWPYLGVNDELWAVILPVCSSNMVYLPAKFQPTT